MTDRIYGFFRALTASPLGKFIGSSIYPDTRISIESGDIQIDSCRRILVCSDVCVKLRSADMIIEIWGSGLELTSAEPDSITVSGKVSSVEFTPVITSAII